MCRNFEMRKILVFLKIKYTKFAKLSVLINDIYVPNIAGTYTRR